MSSAFDELLSAHHDGELTSAERAVVERELAESADARRELSQLRQVSALLKELPREQLPAEFPQQVLNAIEREMLIATPRVAAASVVGGGSRPAPAEVAARRWIGAGAVLTSAAGLLLLVQAVNDRGQRSHLGGQPQNSSPHLANAPEDAKPFYVASNMDSPVPTGGGFGGGGARSSAHDAMIGAAGANPVVANGNVDNIRQRSVNFEQYLNFDRSKLRTAEIGDVVRALQTEGDEVAVVWLTVVDRQQGLEGLEVLLANNHFVRSEPDAGKLAFAAPAAASAGASEAKKAQAENAQGKLSGASAGFIRAVLVESDADQLTAALTQLRRESFVESLVVDQPILVAQLEEARKAPMPVSNSDVARKADVGDQSSESAKRDEKAASRALIRGELAKTVAGPSAPPVDAKGLTSDKAALKQESRVVARQSTLAIPLEALIQGQAVPEALARLKNQNLPSRGVARRFTAPHEAQANNRSAVASDARPLQVLFVVVDQSQTLHPEQSGGAAKPAETEKGRAKPAKPADNEGAA